MPTVPPPVSPSTHSFESFLRGKPPSITWALHNLELTNLSLFLQGIEDKASILGISDGSFKDGKGTAHWILRIQGEAQSDLEGDCWIPGDPSDQSAYRSELGGVYGMLCFLRLLCDFFGISELPLLSLGCDGDSAVWQSGASLLRMNLDRDHFDMIGAIRKLRTGLPGSCTFIRVDGHADDDKDRKLTEAELLNCRCDERAKAFLVTGPGSSPPQYTIWLEPWPLFIQGSKVCRRSRQRLTWEASGKHAVQYWVAQAKIPSGAAVAWQAVAKAMSSVPVTRQNWVVKHLSGRSAVGIEMFRRKEWPHSRCPRCSEPFETHEHVTLCPNATEVWATSLKTLDQWLSVTTSLDIRRSIISRLDAWHNGSTAPTLAVYSARTAQALRLQDSIGWHSFLGGFLSEAWIEAQDEYATMMGLRTKPLTWCSTLITKLWQLTWDLWDDRNNSLHHSEFGAARTAVRQSLRQYYADDHHIYPAHCQVFFQQALQTHLDAPYRTQAAWVRRLDAGRDRLKRQQEYDSAQQQAQRDLMVSHFQITPPCTHNPSSSS